MAQSSTQTCRLCTEKSGVFYCYECQHALCSICRKRHDIIPARNGHTITNISTVDLAVFGKISHCRTHRKEFLFFCVKCSVFICSRCVISTHKDHYFSGITETVLKVRSRAQLQITEAIPNIQEEVKYHIEQLHVDSKKCIETINCAGIDIQTYIEKTKHIHITEFRDNEILEHQSCKSFLRNTTLINERYTRIISELEQILSEKHDLTFHSRYGVIDIDIQNLVGVQAKPPLSKVKSFEKEMFYKDIIEQIQNLTTGKLLYY